MCTWARKPPRVSVVTTEHCARHSAHSPGGPSWWSLPSPFPLGSSVHLSPQTLQSPGHVSTQQKQNPKCSTMSSSAPDGHPPGSPRTHTWLSPTARTRAPGVAHPQSDTHRRGPAPRGGSPGPTRTLGVGAERHLHPRSSPPPHHEPRGHLWAWKRPAGAEGRPIGPGVRQGEVGGRPPPREVGRVPRGPLGSREGRGASARPSPPGGAVTASSGAAARPGAPPGRARRPPTPRRAATRCTCAPGPRRRPRPPPRTPRRRTCAAR